MSGRNEPTKRLTSTTFSPSEILMFSNSPLVDRHKMAGPPPSAQPSSSSVVSLPLPSLAPLRFGVAPTTQPVQDLLQVLPSSPSTQTTIYPLRADSFL